MMLELLERSQSLTPKLVAELSKNPRTWAAVHGASLEVDEFWSRSIANEVFGSPESTTEQAVTKGLWQTLEGIKAKPAGWMPKGWEIYAPTNGMALDKKNPNPYRLRVWLKHGLPPQVMQELKEVDGIPIVYEVREPIVASDFFSSIASYFRDLGNADLSVGCGGPLPTAGTLGGYLQSDQGATYLVSCGHVLGPIGTQVYAPGPFENRRSDMCAIVRESVEPPAGIPQAQAAALPPDATLDVAAAEILPGWLERLPKRQMPRIVRAEPRLMSHQPVYFVGKVSGYMEAEVAPSLGLWAQLTYPDETSRFVRNVFEIDRPLGKSGPVAQRGDSGAWICDRAGDVVCWDGILIGVYRDRAYCSFAHPAKAALERTLGPTRLM